MVSFLKVLQGRGYTFRQHLDEVSWADRKLTVVDLNEAQQAALDQGQGDLSPLKKHMDAQGQWTFPAMDITAPLPRAAGVDLVKDGQAQTCIVAPEADHWQTFAASLVDALAKHTGQKLSVVRDDADIEAILKNGPAILLGGADENQAAKAMALRYRTCFVDASVPGQGGWLVTTHAGLNTQGHNVLQVAASPEHHAAALACIETHIQRDPKREGDDAVISHVHHVAPGPALKGRFPTWEQFAADLPKHILQLENKQVPLETDPVALSHLLAKGLDCGGPEVSIYNAAPIDLIIQAARYYQVSADTRGLTLFRELLFRLADYYLLTPEGASYPADIDFRIGTVLNYYARLEHLPVFSDEDRLILANLFLSCFRSVHEYTTKRWPIDPKIQKRFNHQTFKAMNLEFGADYFDRYHIADTAAWRAYPKSVFIDSIWRRWKHKENAGTYELFVHGHAGAWLMFQGKTLTPEQVGCMKKLVERQIATTDNFFKPVDYGDAGLNMKPVCTGMARLVALNDPDARIKWFAEQDIVRGGDDLPRFLLDHPGIHCTPPVDVPAAGAWEHIPLDPAFTADYAPEIDPNLAFDKLAFRTGWNDNDQYLLWEGVGNLAVGHSHNEVNGIVRFNDRGRHWLVSNGYGRRVGVTNVGKSYSTRVRGPEDHNTLVLKREGKTVIDLPACATLLQRGSQANFCWGTAAVSNYAGIDWRRTVVINRGAFLLIIDRININEPGLEAAHLEWNALGESSQVTDGYRLEQQGVFMHLTSNSAWANHHEFADRSICWKNVLDSKRYPYASFPLNKFVYQMPETEAGKSHTLVTLLVGSETKDAPYRLADASPSSSSVESNGSLSVLGQYDDSMAMSAREGDLAIACDTGRCDVTFDA